MTEEANWESLDFAENLPPESKSRFIPDDEVFHFVDALFEGRFVENVSLQKLQDPNTTMFWIEAKRKIGFVSPTLIWAENLKQYIGNRKVLEICSGTGLVAKYLRAVGVDLIATDDMSWHAHPERDWTLYTEVEELDFREAIKKYRADILFMCWPPYEEPIATDAAKLFTELNPDGIILFIGEYQGGCVADDDFFDGTEEIEEFDNSLFPRWYGLYDYVQIRKWVGLPENGTSEKQEY